jgi:hypothetical protein
MHDYNTIMINSTLNCSNPDCGNHDHINSGEELKTCSGCGGAKYCSAKCQKVHWKKTHRHVCKNLRERRTLGFKSNTSKLVKEAGRRIPQITLAYSYLEINDDDNAVRALSWDSKRCETAVFEKKVNPLLWRDLMAPVQPRLDNMMPCKRVIVVIYTDHRGKITTTVYILCVCPSFCSKCPAPLSMRRLEF